MLCDSREREREGGGGLNIMLEGHLGDGFVYLGGMATEEGRSGVDIRRDVGYSRERMHGGR